MTLTVTQTLQRARRALSGVSDAPALDAEWLLTHVLDVSDPTHLLTHSERVLTPAETAAFMAALATRQQGVPLAYILGEWDFYGRTFFVTPAVLVPRPATEALVDQALSIIATWSAQYQRPLRVADIGTGSGCIAITLARETKTPLHLVATDISSEALAVARRNATRHSVSAQIEFIQGDMLVPLHDWPVDLIVSNPPYVPAADLAQADSARDTHGLIFEPPQALIGGADGQQYVQALLRSGIPAIVESTDGQIVSTVKMRQSRSRASRAVTRR